MNLNQIESKIQNLVKFHNPFEFIFEFLASYNIPKATVTRLKKGNSNLSKQQGEVILKKKLFFREELMMDLHETISLIENNHKHDERFLIVTDWKIFLAIDTKTNDRLDIEFNNLPRHFDFFLPLAGMEKTQHANENPADVKASEKMAKLFDAIKQNNPDDSKEFVHSLNVFLSRLLFCFFAEDTNIFEENQFTNAISSHTQSDGSDLDDYLAKLFEVLNTPPGKRKNLPSYLNAFPYVNGGLFKYKFKVPKFNRKSRQSIIDSGELNWSDINPDIFGSMFQAVIDVDQRASLGQHYTSVPNILKVIEPLFLDNLNSEFENAIGNKKKLIEFIGRLENIKVFDPACGTGNFLIIAYKELRRLEIKAFEALKFIAGDVGTVSLDFGADYLSHISLNNFFGIELDNFAHEIAKLALWLAEHQMNLEFFSAIGHSDPTLPLKDTGQIINANSTTINWKDVCPISGKDEIYILGNPPYLGSSMQNEQQKKDLAQIFKSFKNYKNLDYIACWFKKGADFIQGNPCSSFAFVSTNSICQGEQVDLLWPYIFSNNQEISFAHQSFPWSNSAKGKAKVIVIIVGIRNLNDDKKYLYSDGRKQEVKNVNPYLTEGGNITLPRRGNPISNIPTMLYGNKSTDDGKLFLTPEERLELISTHPESEKFIKKLVGSVELIRGIERYCLWIEDKDVDDAIKIPWISKRMNSVREFRLKSKAQSTVDYAQYSHRFKQRTYDGSNAIVIPRVSSQRRKYIPFGYVDGDTVVLDSAQAIYNAQPWILAVVLSNMHNVWVKATSGRLKSDIRYSSALSYNNFPFPNLSTVKKDELTQSVLKILDIRQKYSERSLSELYSTETMPNELIQAHDYNDKAVERCYRITPFRDDKERLEYLFKQYEEMIEEKQSANTLFAKQKKTRRKR